MKSFNQTQIDELKQYEIVFFRAVHQDYYRSMSRKVLDALKAMYDETQDSPYSANWSCSHCVLTFLKTIGKKYYDDKKALEEKAAELVKAIDEVFQDVPDIEVQIEPEPKPVKKAPAKKTNKKVTKK